MNVLVVLLQPEGADALISPARDALEAGDLVTVLSVHDPQYADRVCNKLTEDGWLGKTRSAAVGQELTEHYEHQFEHAAGRLAAALGGEDGAARTLVRCGDLINTVMRTIEDLGDVRRVVVGHPRHGLFKRLFRKLNLKLLVDRAPCEVRLVALEDG